MSKITEVESWISSNQDSEAEDYEGKQKEIERIYNPIMQKAYQGAGQGGCGQEYANQYQNQNQAGPSAD